MAVLPGGNGNSTIGVEIITAADTAGIAETDASLASLGKTVQATNAAAGKGLSLSGLSSSLEKTGRALLPISLGIAAIGGASIKSAISFQQQMTYIRTQAGDTTDSISTLSKEVLDLATKSQYGPEQLAEGLYHLTSLGLRGAQAMKALDASQRLAAIGGADLESTTSAVGAAMVTGIKGTQDLNETVGILNSTIGAGNMRMQDLVGALGTGTLSVFKNAGLSLTEFGAALATLTDNGQQADAAATHLRMTISLMAAPSAAAEKQLAAIGMTGQQMAIDMQTKGLVPALQDLKQHLLDTFGTTKEGAAEQEAALTRIFGGGRSSAAIQTLLDQLPRVQSKIKQITSQSGQAANDYAKQMQTANAKLKTAWSDIQVDAIKLGAALLPSVASAAGKIAAGVNDISERFNELSPTAKKVIEDIALGFAVGAPLMIGVAKLRNAISAIGSTIFTLAKPFMWMADQFIAQIARMSGAEGIAGASSKMTALRSLVMTNMPMTILVAGALASLGAIWALIQNIRAATRSVNAAYQSAVNASNAQDSFLKTYQAIASGSVKNPYISAAQAKADLNKYASGHATGTNYAPGGWSMVGESGPEMVYLPRGSQVKTASQSSNIDNSSQNSVTIGTVVINTPAAAQEFFRQLNQDTMNLGKGLTPVQGAY